jgi:hypothetical protein
MIDMLGSKTPTYRKFPDDMTLAQWQAIGHELCLEVSARRWWAGDWMAFGQAHFPDAAAKSAAYARVIAELSRDVLTTSEGIAPEHRREDLPWSVHREVAQLEPAQQIAFLERAKAESLTMSELRKAIRLTQAVGPASGKSFAWKSPTKSVREAAAWLKAQPPEFWTPITREMWKKELKPLAELAKALER